MHLRRLTVALAVPAAVVMTLGVMPPAMASPAPASISTGDSSSRGSFRDNCTILGTSGNDLLTGTAGNDVICGLGGDDIIRGLGGSDILIGGPGDDRIYGGAGADRLAGQSGTDTVRGGTGNDIIAKTGQADDLDAGTGNDQIIAMVPFGTDPGDNISGSVLGDMSFDLPAGTRVEYFYVADGSNCSVNGLNHNGEWDIKHDKSVNFFDVPKSKITESCAWERSYATWQIRITIPGRAPLTGSLYVTTGLPNSLVVHADVSCHDFTGPYCKGGETTARHTDFNVIGVPFSLGLNEQ